MYFVLLLSSIDEYRCFVIYLDNLLKVIWILNALFYNDV